MMTTNTIHNLILLLLPCSVIGKMEQLDSILFFGGRWWSNSEGMHHSWGIGSFHIRFRGSSLLKVKIKSGWSDGLFYTCKINGLDEKLYQNSEDYMTIAEDLDPSIQYNIWCSRNNEASWGITTISSVVLDEGGELLQATDPNSNDSMLRIEFVGDSITAGFKVSASSVSEPSTTSNQDVHLAYPRHLADLFQTSGKILHMRLSSNCTIRKDIEATGVPMPLEYPCEDFYWDWQGSCPSLHDFSSWQADVVVVNLGTNDYVYGSPIQPWLFKQTYLAFLQDIRAKYPASIIAVIEPLLLSCSEDSLLSDISDAILQAAVDMDDDRVIFYPTGTVNEPWLSCRDDYIDYTHPNIEGSIKFADKLYESMKDDICSVFPNKCGAETTSGNVPVLYCGSSSCTQQVWDTLAGRYTCGSRIEWLQKLGYSESESCTIVEDEFPTICLCAPDSSPQSNSSKAITMRPSFTPSTAPTKSPIKLQKTDNNIFVATSVPSPTLPPAQAVVDRISCVAITQSELAPGLWATTDELCRQCEPPNPITWWPCDLSPPLCRCNPTDVISSPTPPPVVPTEPTAISCVAVNQEDLPSDSDLWATTDESCKQCEPPNPITWWPCNTELCLCT